MTMADPTTAGGGTEGLREALINELRAEAHRQAKAHRYITNARYGPTYESLKAESTACWRAADALARASAEQARVEAERDVFAVKLDGSEARVRILHEHMDWWRTKARAAETNLIDLAKMYGEACGELQTLRLLLTDVAVEADAANDAAEAHGDALDGEIDLHNEATARALDAESRIASLTAERDRLKAAIQAFLDGNYDHPRRYRPGKCPHGIYYFDECPSCDEVHFTAALNPPEAPDAP